MRLADFLFVGNQSRPTRSDIEDFDFSCFLVRLKGVGGDRIYGEVPCAVGRSTRATGRCKEDPMDRQLHGRMLHMVQMRAYSGVNFSARIVISEDVLTPETESGYQSN